MIRPVFLCLRISRFKSANRSVRLHVSDTHHKMSNIVENERDQHKCRCKINELSSVNYVHRFMRDRKKRLCYVRLQIEPFEKRSKVHFQSHFSRLFLIEILHGKNRRKTAIKKNGKLRINDNSIKIILFFCLFLQRKITLNTLNVYSLIHQVQFVLFIDI